MSLLARQIGYDLRSWIRNPPVLFFGLLLPVIFLLIFATIFGNETLDSRGGIKQSTYYVPGLIALGVISTTFVNLAISLTIMRENRVLKRLRGTPLPPWLFFTGRMAAAMVFAVLLTVVLVGIGAALYGVEIPDSTLPGVIVSVAVGSIAFCALGIAFSAVIPNEDAAPPIVNALVLPLYFISGLFFPVDDAPQWLQDLASVFPIGHLAEALFTAFDPETQGAGVDWGNLWVVGVWGLAGVLLAFRFFRWTPKGE
ncbi:MAG: ABC transporter permease [Thermoleophilaceae bacterium]|nr:ABC transporter permease [Thermoleophilaceae bacterium]